MFSATFCIWRVAIAFLPQKNSGLWLGVTVLSNPTIAAIARFSAALMALIFSDPSVDYEENFSDHAVMMVPCYTEGP